MELKEYQEKAFTTAIYPKDHLKNITYPVLGLCDEIAEVDEKFMHDADDEELLKEIGDVCWYIAAIASELDLNLENLDKDLLCRDTMSIYAGKIAGKTKKLIRDKEGIITNKYKDFVEENLINILCLVKSLIIQYDSTLSQVLQDNVDKLFSRKERGVLKGNGDNR